MNKDENCIFCKIIANVIPSYKVYEDENSFGFLDITPVQKGHMLLVPKNHTDYIFDIEDDEYSSLFLKAKELSIKIKEFTNTPRVGIVVEGFGVAHAHVHLIPISGPNQFDSTLKYKASEEELSHYQSLYSF